MRQKGILLGLVEPMNFVDEEDGPSGRRIARRCSAVLMIARSSGMPPVTAENGTNWALVCRATRCASVVLPEPGGPQKMTEES